MGKTNDLRDVGEPKRFVDNSMCKVCVTVIAERCPFHGKSRASKEETESKQNIPSGAEAIGAFLWSSWNARWKFTFISSFAVEIFPSSGPGKGQRQWIRKNLRAGVRRYKGK